MKEGHKMGQGNRGRIGGFEDTKLNTLLVSLYSLIQLRCEITGAVS